MEILLQIIGILFWFVVILIPLVVIHEFGHLLMSRLVGVRVVEFGVGIPPRVWYRKWRGIIWSINAVWLGGFAKIYGDHDAIDEAYTNFKINPKNAKSQYVVSRVQELVEGKELEFFLEENNLKYTKDWKELEESGFLLGTLKEEVNEKTAQKYDKMVKQLETLISWELENKIGSGTVFYNKNIFQKTLIILGGILFNLITAFVLFFVLIGFVSTPVQPMLLDEVRSLDDTVQVDSISNNIILLSVVKDSPAYDAGIRGGDSLIRFAGLELNELESFENFSNLVDSKEGETVPVTYISRDTGEEVSTEVELVRESEGDPLFGVGRSGFGYLVSLKARDISTAVGLAARQTWTIFKLNFEILGNIVKAILPFATDRSALNAVGGPVAVGNVGTQIYDLQGASGILNIMAVVSVSLAAFNLLPLPALDGGRLLIIYLNRLTGRRNKRLEGALIGFTFVLLLGLGLVIAFRDVNNIVQGRSLF